MFNNIPVVTKNLLIINILVYIITIVFAQKSGNAELANQLSAHYFNSSNFEPYQMVSHMFVHSLSDFFHIIFNMFLLVMFGSHLERIWGAKRYFIFYFACGLGALALYNTIGVIEISKLKNELISAGYQIDTLDFYIAEGEPNKIKILSEVTYKTVEEYYLMSISSMAGASGAIFGLLAGFAILFPNTELMLLFPPIPIKAKYLIGGYLAFEIYNSYNQPNDNIAHLAHVGGAVVGIIMVLFWRKFDKKNFY